MAGYKHDITVALDEFAEGGYAVLRNPKAFLSIADIAPLEAPRTDAGEIDTEAATEMANARARQTLTKLIRDWNVPDLRDEEHRLPLPSEDADALLPDRCPEFVVLELMRQVNEVLIPFLQRGTTPPAAKPVPAEPAAA